MKKIIKKSSPKSFDIWKADFLKQNGYVPDYSKLIGDEKQKIREKLYEEQYGLCCYCCKLLKYPYTNSEEFHIEHFRPKSNTNYSHLGLEYSNLHLSCSGYKSNRECCGHKKDDWFDEKLTVSPLEENVEELFEYTIDGHIKAAGGNIRAIETIKNLQLDSFNLQRQRKTAIYMAMFYDSIEEDYEEEKKSIIRDYKTAENGVLKSFCNAVIYCIEKNN